MNTSLHCYIKAINRAKPYLLIRVNGEIFVWIHGHQHRACVGLQNQTNVALNTNLL